MARAPALIVALAIAAPGAARAMEEVHSVQEVFPAEGQDHQTLAKRALVCIPKFATSGLTTANTIVSSDVEAGFVQARNAWKGSGMFGLNYRTTITFEAKDGRFRISHGEFEVATDRSAYSAMNYPGGALLDMRNQSTRIAACVISGPVSDDF
jgi:hypothetical protein